MTREIPLTKGYVALVDDEDYDLVAEYRWSARISARTVYAETWIKTDKGPRILLMHRLILGLRPGQTGADHKDRDGLNNQRANLRTATSRQNAQNRRIGKNNTSGFKGVHRVERKNPTWRAAIYDGGIRYPLGYFTSPEDAARAYDERAKALYGEFAVLNFPEGGIAA